MSKPFDDVQRIVLRGSHWQEARHLVLGFGERAASRHFLHRLKADCWPTAASARKPEVQISLGFGRRGLEHAHVPKHVLACFALKSPAFSAGAALRASRHLGASGCNVPAAWHPAFSFMRLDAVLSLHAMDDRPLEKVLKEVQALAKDTKVQMTELVPARRLLDPPAGERPDPHAQWVHFGYRDGLAHIGINGWTAQNKLDRCKPISRHEAGEFLLGHAQDSGANPWIAGPGLRVWPEELRSFFHNGSFGVLHQIEQNVAAFEQFVEEIEKATGLEPSKIKAKLCGRYPDGRPLAAPENARPVDDFDYAQDGGGYGCPFGAHVRRMNPRGDDLAHAIRARPLLRRGMPYGPPWHKASPSDEQKRGLLGQFFCASIEDQFEHLVGQWADRVPLGSADRGSARDPLIGAHEPGDGAFEVPQGKGKPPIMLDGLRPFTRTVGLAYLFYPSLPTLEGIADHRRWHALVEDDE